MGSRQFIKLGMDRNKLETTVLILISLYKNLIDGLMWVDWQGILKCHFGVDITYLIPEKHMYLQHF